jgi:hypothetical protein
MMESRAWSRRELQQITSVARNAMQQPAQKEVNNPGFDKSTRKKRMEGVSAPVPVPVLELFADKLFTVLKPIHKLSSG